MADASINAVIGPDTVVRGTLRGEEDLEVQGTVEGRVELHGDLVVLAGGQVNADIKAREVRVYGSITGTVLIADRLHIAPGARVQTEIRCPGVELTDGGWVKGHIDTASEREELIDAVLDQLGESNLLLVGEPKWSRHSVTQ